MTAAADIVRAMREGRSADLGSSNPYVGEGVLATAWQQGYLSMVRDRIAAAPSRQPYIESEKPTAAP